MNRLQKLVTKNVGLKLLSLALAVALWAAVGSDPVTEASFRIPLEFINVPANFEVLTEQPTVQLWARGPSQAVRRAVPGDFVVRVDVAPFPKGLIARTYSLERRNAKAPAPLQVVELIPSDVRLTFQTFKDVPVNPRFSGELPRGYRVKSSHVNRSTMRIIGSAISLNPISAVSTDPIDLTRLKASTSLVANVSVPDPSVHLAYDPAVVVTIEVEKSDESAPQAPVGLAH